MLSQLIEMLMQPESYVCEWRGNELYIEPVVAVAVPAE